MPHLKKKSLPARPAFARGRQVPKLCGADFELGNFILGVETPRGTGALASQLLLQAINGRPLARGGPAAGESFGLNPAPAPYSYAGPSDSGYNPQDRGRKFLQSNGGCVYIDLDHLELCLPEVLHARDHVAATHAMLRIARAALQNTNARLNDGFKIVALANNSDGQGNSYGSHLDFLITRRAWDNLFQRRLHSLLFLATYQVSSIVFTGQGKVGSENRKPHVPYQISQRADFFEVLTGIQTTARRPIVNSRDEPLCGTWRDSQENPPTADLARLHVIFYDQTLCHAASLLKVGVMQIILAMIEAEWIEPELALEDPLDALLQWSHDPALGARARLTSGQAVTAVELQLRFCEEAERFVAAGGCDGLVPEASFILNLWSDTLGKLHRRDYAALAPRLDWVLKWHLLQRARQQRDLDWTAPELKHLDYMYGSLEDGLYWTYERAGLVETMVSDADIARLQLEPPDSTRAWTRAQLLRLAEPEEVERVDWDCMTFSFPSHTYWPRQRTVRLANPLGFGKATCARVFESSATLEEALDLLGAPASDLSPEPSSSQGWLYPTTSSTPMQPAIYSVPSKAGPTSLQTGTGPSHHQPPKKEGDQNGST